MRTTFGSVAFQLFDKVIVAILVLLALFYVAAAVIKEPDVVFDKGEVEALKAKIETTQLGSRHERQELKTDYLSATVGSFRPDLAGFEPRPYVMGGKPKVIVTKLAGVSLMWDPREPKTSSVEVAYPDYANA